MHGCGRRPPFRLAHGARSGRYSNADIWMKTKSPQRPRLSGQNSRQGFARKRHGCRASSRTASCHVIKIAERENLHRWAVRCGGNAERDEPASGLEGTDARRRRERDPGASRDIARHRVVERDGRRAHALHGRAGRNVRTGHEHVWRNARGRREGENVARWTIGRRVRTNPTFENLRDRHHNPSHTVAE